MDTEKLPQFVILLVAIGMLLGIGTVVLDNFGSAVKVSTAVTNESITMANVSGVLTGSTSNNDVTSVQFFGNTTLNSTTVPITAFTSAGVITVPWNYTNTTYRIDYTYDADSAATTSSNSTVTALSAISTTWLSLIVTIAMLSIVMLIVVRKLFFKR